MSINQQGKKVEEEAGRMHKNKPSGFSFEAAQEIFYKHIAEMLSYYSGISSKKYLANKVIGKLKIEKFMQ